MTGPRSLYNIFVPVPQAFITEWGNASKDWEMFSDHFHFEILNYLRGLYFEGYKKLAREIVCLVYLVYWIGKGSENRYMDCYPGTPG